MTLTRFVAASICATLGFTSSSGWAQDKWSLKEGQHVLKFTSSNPENMAGGFLLFLPKGYESGKWPLIVYLHARGESGADAEWIRGRGLPRLVEKQPDFKFIVASPQLQASAGFFDVNALNAFLDEVLAKLPTVDRDRIYLFGISLGGKSVYEWAATAPTRFAAAVPISNRWDPERVCPMKTVPVWAFHNDRDPVVPLSGAQKTIEAINACGGKAKLTVYPDRAEHNAWDMAYANGELWDWVLAQKRAP